MCVSFVIGIGITYLLSTRVPDLFSEVLLSSYISGSGSFLGGLIGGIVAFVVARTQITSERKRIQNSKNNKINNQLSLLIVELKSHLEIFQMMSSIEKSKREEYRNSINLDVWKEVKYDLSDQIDQEDFESLSNYYYDCREIVDGTLPDYVEITDEDLEIRINLVKKRLENLELLKGKL